MLFEYQRLAEIISAFQTKSVLIIGDIMIDEYLWGDVHRLSPEAPVPVIEVAKESIRFGGAANVAFNLKTLGCRPVLIGLRGTDMMGQQLESLLEETGLNSSGIIQSALRPTTVKTRIIGNNQHIARVDREIQQEIDSGLEDKVLEKTEQHLVNCDALIFEDYNKGLITSRLIREITALSREKKIPVLVDPKFNHFMEYKQATVFKPNIKEAAQALARKIETDEEVNAAGNDLLEKLAAESILLTRGPKGTSLFARGREPVHIPTLARKVADVSGAGDTVISAFTAALTGGASLSEAAFLANFAAGMVVEEVGIIPIRRDDLLHRLKETHKADEAHTQQP